MINVKQWIDLPQYVRSKIARDFNLNKSGRVGISRNVIISDGYTQDDLLKINLKNLQTLMDSDEQNFDELFDQYKGTISPLDTITVDIASITPVATPVVEIEEKIDLTIAPSGDKETYFGTKIKPVSYEKTKKRK